MGSECELEIGSVLTVGGTLVGEEGERRIVVTGNAGTIGDCLEDQIDICSQRLEHR